METYHCIINRVLFQDFDSGWSVIAAKAMDVQIGMTLRGELSGLNEGEEIDVEGEWVQDAKYGTQFDIKSFKVTTPASTEGIERYLGSGIFKGIGKKRARMIVNKFGIETISILDSDIERLKTIPGITETILAKIASSWKVQKKVQAVMIFLHKLHVSAAYASRIVEVYGSAAIEIIKEQPYKLAIDIRGIGFKLADKIAMAQGIQKTDPYRLRSGLMFCLIEICGRGHVFAYRNQLINKASGCLGIDYTLLEEMLSEMDRDGQVVIEDNGIYLPRYHEAEREAAQLLKHLLRTPTRGGNPEFADGHDIDKLTDLDPTQREAVRMAVRRKVMILTGGPGTGKTTTTKEIIMAMKRRDLKVRLGAPTGRAAKRMEETANDGNNSRERIEATTIHRLLEFNPLIGYVRNEEHKLERDVLIVDECSMIDQELFYRLLQAVPESMRLILVGDADQLPSVGSGNVLHDIIASGVIEVCKLTKVFRQGANSHIVSNAHRINNGEFPEIDNSHDSDFFFIDSEGTENISNEIIGLVRNRLPKKYDVSPFDIQVLSPMRKGVIGTMNLNLKIQEAVNPENHYEPGLKHGKTTYRKGDKVIQVSNDYTKMVMNGDMGVVHSVNSEDGEMEIIFDNRFVKYEDEEISNIKLGYALTVHKAQGAESDIVVIPIDTSFSIMLQRNLIYTAVTRAKKICVLVGSKEALARAIENNEIRRRNTRLKARLQGAT